MEESHIQDQQTVCCHAGLKAHHAVGQEAFFSDAGRGAFLLLATSFLAPKKPVPSRVRTPYYRGEITTIIYKAIYKGS